MRYFARLIIGVIETNDQLFPRRRGYFYPSSNTMYFE